MHASRAKHFGSETWPWVNCKVPSSTIVRRLQLSGTALQGYIVLLSQQWWSQYNQLYTVYVTCMHALQETSMISLWYIGTQCSRLLHAQQLMPQATLEMLSGWTMPHMLVLMHIHDHASLLQLRMRSDQFCRVCWPTMMSVCLNQVPRFANNCHATPREACYPLLWTMWWVSSKCHFIYCCNDVYNLWIGQGHRYCFDGNNSATSPHSQTATSILAIIKVWK